MIDGALGQFDPVILSPLERKNLLRYYRRNLEQIRAKRRTLLDGKHTLLSANGLDLLDQIISEYKRRIGVLETLTKQLSRKRT